MVCPSCGSSNVHVMETYTNKARYACLDCGAEWTKTKK